MADEVIANPKVKVTAETKELLQGIRDASGKFVSTLDLMDKKSQKIAQSGARRIQGYISSINAEKPKQAMWELSQAIAHMGGAAKLSGDQADRARKQIEALAAAGAKIPKTLASLAPAAGPSASTRLFGAAGAAVAGQLSGQVGIAGTALASLGPSGVAAAAGVGAVTIAVGAAAKAVADLAAEAEQWSNVSQATGIGVVAVQQLQDYLVDAGFDADSLTTMMKKLQTEIATGGEEFRKYGINLQELRALAPEEQLRKVAEAVLAIVDPTERAAAAQEFFGKNGSRQLAALAGIADGTYKQLHALNEQQIDDLKRVDEALDHAGRAWENWSKRALVALLDVAAGHKTEADARRAAANTRGGAMGGAGNAPPAAPMPWSALARISNPATFLDTSPLTLGPEEADTRRRVANATAETEEAEKKLAAERKRAAAEALRRVQEENNAAAALVKLREHEIRKIYETNEAIASKSFAAEDRARQPVAAGALGDPRAADQAAYEMGIRLAQTAQKTGLSLEQIRGKLEGMGLSAQDVDSILANHLKKQEGAKKGTETLSDSLGSLTDHLQTLAGVTGGTAGKILNFAASISSGIGGAIQGFKQLTQKGGPGGILGTLGKVSGALGIVGSAVGVVSGLVSGIKSLFGGKSKEEKAAEAAAKKQAEEEKKQARVRAEEERKQGLLSAKGFAESLMDRLAKGGLSEGLGKALQAIVGKIGDALLRSGLGVLDTRLRQSEQFQEAQGLAGDVAGALGAAGQAGIFDAGLMAAGGQAAQAIMAEAIAAAKMAGLGDAEAQKAGFASVAGILREQLNASIRSGQELDENTARLLEEARANGLEILADPAIESLNVQKKQLDVLERIAGSRGGTIHAASGLGPVRMPNLGRGLGPLIQTHAGEYALIVPAHMARRGGIIAAARGVYEDGEDRRGRRGEDGVGESGSPGGDGGAGPEAGGEAGATPMDLAAVADVVSQVIARTPRVAVNSQTTINNNNDPFATKERREDADRAMAEMFSRRARRRDAQLAADVRYLLGGRL